MSNIYDEALEHVKNGSDDLYSYQVLSIKQALERAKKVEELLGMYQEKEKLSHNPYNNKTGDIRPFYEWACELTEFEKQIKQKEKELEEMK